MSFGRRNLGRANSDGFWKQLCSAQQRFMSLNPDTRCTHIENRIYQAVFSKSVGDLRSRSDFDQITVDNFRDIFELLINVEEAWEHTNMRKHDMKGVVISKIDTASMPLSDSITSKPTKLQYRLEVPGLSKGQPSLIPSDAVIIDDGSKRYSLDIVSIENDLVTIERMNSVVETMSVYQRFDVSFVPSGTNYCKFVEALEFVSSNRRTREVLFGRSLTGQVVLEQAAKIDFCMSARAELDERLESLNERQKQAIKHILEARCRPNLYILFGPPGTGKSSTIVEAVVQIHRRNRAIKILICSGSNTCVDRIAANIQETGQIDSMVRVSSKQNLAKKIDRPNDYTKELDDVESSKVIVTTNTMAARLPTGLVFDYVFVDEAGHAHVCETMIPITRLHSDGCLVLAGDPRQLGPVIKSFEADKLGLGKSLLERLCDRDPYQRRDGHYDEKYITQLVISYRCDPNILGICNDLFYNGDLECLGKTPPSLLKILNIDKPLVHVKVDGDEERHGKSTSRCNSVEAVACAKILIRLYKLGLEPDQVGIITPYTLQSVVLRRQVKEEIEKHRPLLDERFRMPPNIDASKEKPLKAAKDSTIVVDGDIVIDLSELLLDPPSKKSSAEEEPGTGQETESTGPQKVPVMDWRCKIDTVDAFQGSEREVIIVSTVRSANNFGQIDQKGFLADAKRFNVTISRAKWLVIVVGHSAVLNCCDYWKEFSNHASKVGTSLW